MSTAHETAAPRTLTSGRFVVSTFLLIATTALYTVSVRQGTLLELLAATLNTGRWASFLVAFMLSGSAYILLRGYASRPHKVVRAIALFFAAMSLLCLIALPT